MKKKTLDEAIEVIKEYGITPDSFIMEHFQQFMSGGDPDDNSVELHSEYMQCLRLVVGAGLSTHPSWISVGDEIPPSNIRLLGIGMKGAMFIFERGSHVFREKNGISVYVPNARNYRTATHWTTLPDPPDGK